LVDLRTKNPICLNDCMVKLRLLTVTDLHCVASLYDELNAAVEKHKPDIVALVGDFLDVLGSPHKQLSPAECARVLAALPCSEVIFTRGNHEHYNWWEFEKSWSSTGRKLQALHGEAFVVGPLVIVGFPCELGDETAFVGNLRPLPFEADRWLSDLLHVHGPAMRTLWLMHEPPSGTALTVKSGPVSGNRLWKEVIEHFSPWLVIAGHDHGTPIRTGRWQHCVGPTHVANVGQTAAGPLHYAIVEADFSKNATSLPVSMKIIAYPKGESLTLPTVGTSNRNRGKQGRRAA